MDKAGDKLREAGFSTVVTALAELPAIVSTGGDLGAFASKLADAILADHNEIQGKQQAPVAPAPAPLPTIVNTTPAAAKMQGVSFLSPRGKFDLEFRDGSLQLESKTTGAVECKLASVESVFDLALPNTNPKVKVSLFAVLLSTPLTFGKSTVSYLVLQGKDGDKAQASVDGTACAKLATVGSGGTLAGAPNEIVSQLVCILTGLSVNKHDPNVFLSNKQGAAVKCNIKSVHDGFLFPTSKGFWFVNKFVFIARKEVSWIEFGRTSAVSTRTFDLTVMTSGGVKHEFSMIEKEEHVRLLEYIKRTKLKTKEEFDKAKAEGGKTSPGKPDAAKAEKKPEDAVAVKGEADEKAAVNQSAENTTEKVAGASKGGADEDDDDDDDDSDEDDEDFNCDVDSDEESEGYDAVEAMDVENMDTTAQSGDDEEGSDDDSDEEEEEGDEEDVKEEEGGGVSLKTKPTDRGYVPGGAAASGDGGERTEDEDEPPAKKSKAGE